MAIKDDSINVAIHQFNHNPAASIIDDYLLLICFKIRNE